MVKKGFQAVASKNTPWSEAEVQELKDGLKDYVTDASAAAG